jgi:HEAT repeat protein/cyclophilin family peptidyl-prolyl cis-trans isomerase
VTRSTIALVFALGASGCASAPSPLPLRAAEPTFEQKTAWILRLEDQRVLRDPAPAVPPPATPSLSARGNVVASPPTPPPPDLVRLLGDGEARVRRRAALAIGRVGLADGVPPLVAVLADTDPEVRQMAAFALGLIGDRSANEPLTRALGDASPLVKGSAAEALGLIGDPAAAPAIAEMASQLLTSSVLSAVPADALDADREAPAAAYRLALYALVRLKSYEALATAALDTNGQPRLKWWPVAFALQQLEDPRALPALLTLVADPHPYTRAFAAKGLGAMKTHAAVAPLLPLVTAPEMAVAVEAIRALGRLHDPAAGPVLLKLLQTPKLDAHLRLEAVAALGTVGAPGLTDVLIDLLADPSPPVRVAAIRAFAAVDAEGFVTVLSGLDADTHWSVRAALATVLGTLSPEAGLPRLHAMLDDADARVIPAVLGSIVALKAPDASSILLAQLKADDAVVRAAAAQGIAQMKPADALPALTDAYARGEHDTTYVARGAVLAAAAAYGTAGAPLLTTALTDKEWAVRVRAAALLTQLDPANDANRRIRPVPSTDPERYAAPSLISPPFSTEAYIETDRGTIQIELAVVDAPLTVENFATLARKGFFDGLAIHRVVPDFVVQAGDPRGDGEGGPGYTIRDELNERPFLRGTVGMALDWKDTGGSQFFITPSPQPQLDAKYTVFGRVLSGMDVIDRLEPWDVIRHVRIWDGAAGN